MNRNRYRVRGNGNNPNAPTKKFNFLGGTLPSGFTAARAGAGSYWTQNGTYATALTNVARFDYGMDPVLRTNLCLASEAYSVAGWTKTGSTATQVTTVTNPFGENKCFLLSEDLTSGTHVLQSAFTPTTGTITASVYLKRGTARYMQLAWQGTGGVYFNIDLQTGTRTAGSASTWSIVDAGNGWWRCSITMTGTTGNYIYVVHTGDNPTAALTPVYTGTGLTAYAWGAQTEVGSIATGYIPSGANQVGRYVGFTANNLLVQSNVITNGLWLKDGSVGISAVAGVGPSGETAYLQTRTNTSGQQFRQELTLANGAALGGRYTASCYVKLVSGTGVTFTNFDAAGQAQATYNLVTNVTTIIVNGGSTDAVAGMTPVGDNGWWRIWLSFTATSAAISLRVLTIGTTVGHSFYVCNTQINIGDVALPYFDTIATSARGSTSIKGLLVEQTRTNSCLQSRDLTQVANWTATNATVAFTQTGIGATANSASLVTVTTGPATVYQTITQAATPAVFSCYIKRVTGTGAITITQDGGTTSTTVTPSREYWTRYQTPVQSILNPVIGISLATTGDVIIVDGCQFENVSATTDAASAFINTTTAAATRPTETIKAASLTWVNAPAGAVYIDATTGAVTTTATAFNLYNSASATTNHIKVQNASATTLVGSLAANTTAVTTTPLAVSANQRIKAAISYTSGSNLFSLNGSAPATSGAFFTAGVATGLNTLEVGSETGTNQFNGWIREFRYYKKAKTAAQIQALTT